MQLGQEWAGSHPHTSHPWERTPNPVHTTQHPQKTAQNPTHARCEEPLYTMGSGPMGGTTMRGSHCSQRETGDPPHPPQLQGLQPLGPGGVGEGDVVETGPAGEDSLLGDEAMVVTLAAPLIVDVRCALVRALRFIVVIGQAAGWGSVAAVGEGSMG